MISEQTLNEHSGATHCYLDFPMDPATLQTPEEMLERWAGVECTCDPDVNHLCECCHDTQVVRELLKGDTPVPNGDDIGFFSEFFYRLRLLLGRFDVDIVATSDGTVQFQFDGPYGCYEFDSVSSADEPGSDGQHRVA